MPVVEFIIRNTKYNIACDPGEEPHIKKLAESLNVRVEAISASLGSTSDNIALAITALMMEDEISSLKESKTALTEAKTTIQKNPSCDEQVNEALVNAIEPIAEYIEKLANRIESV